MSDRYKFCHEIRDELYDKIRDQVLGKIRRPIGDEVRNKVVINEILYVIWDQIREYEE
jgi:hypothetical protein